MPAESQEVYCLSRSVTVTPRNKSLVANKPVVGCPSCRMDTRHRSCRLCRVNCRTVKCQWVVWRRMTLNCRDVELRSSFPRVGRITACADLTLEPALVVAKNDNGQILVTHEMHALRDQPHHLKVTPCIVSLVIRQSRLSCLLTVSIQVSAKV